MQTYCIIGKLRLVDIEGAKTLKLGYFGGLPYAVSKDYSEDKLYAIFLPDGQITKEYYEANKDELGFFGKNLKVRSIKLMKGQITSVGYVAPLESLAFTGYDLSKLNEGDSFNELNGVKICRKFISRETLALQRATGKTKAAPKGTEVGLPIHPDTVQFYRFASTLNTGDLITVTLKLDGTSVRVANAYVEVPTTLSDILLESSKSFYRLLGKLKLGHWFKGTRRVNRVVTGTRRVIIEKTEGPGYYGNHDMYLEVGKGLDGLLYPGESVYGEIVGWIDNERPLFNRGGMIFKYGCLEGTRDFYVYNIKWTLPNGMSVDLPWNKIKARCKELGLKYVPEMNTVDVYSYEEGDIEYAPVEPMIYDGNLDELEKLVYSLVDGPDLIDPSHIREGVVLRVEKKNGETVFYKAKSKAFYELEDKSKEEGQVDIEEAQDDISDITDVS